jgi:RNA polymerase sigma-70 factor (ECF subfamily)
VLKEIFEKEYNRLVNYTRRLFDDTADVNAEDIVQEVALNMFSRVDFDSDVENGIGYVFRAIRNKVIDMYRKRKVVISIDKDEEESDVPELKSEEISVEANIELEEEIELMNIAIESLSDDHREIVVATEIEGRSFAEIAEETGIPVGTLLSRKHRAMANLQRILRDINII